jgi:3-phosphoshikimate 1-carboxyvinyltransferase
VCVSGLDLKSSQADRRIMDILKQMGAHITDRGGDLSTRTSRLCAVNYDLSDCPDLFPVVSALCAAAEGESRLSGLSRLRFKESDRIEAMTAGLTRMGAEIKVNKEEVYIKGSRLIGATIDPFGDHRIAMALAVLSLAAEGETIVRDADCVSKSYPHFWMDFERIGIKARRIKG